MILKKYFKHIKYNVIVSKFGKVLIKNNEGKIYAEDFYKCIINKIESKYLKFESELNVQRVNLKQEILEKNLSDDEVREKEFESMKNWYEKNNVKIVNMINESFEESGYDIKLFFY